MVFLKLYNDVITVVKATSACPVNLFAIVPDGKPFLPKKFEITLSHTKQLSLG